MRRKGYIALISIIFSVLICIGIGGGKLEVYASDMENSLVVPKPERYESREGEFVLRDNSKIYVHGKNKAETDKIFEVAEVLKKRLEKATGYRLEIARGINKETGILLTTMSGGIGLGREGYNLYVSEGGVHMNAYKVEGLSRGINTLLQLFPPEIYSGKVVKKNKWSLKGAYISDKPKYEYRGLMIDVARHFFTMDDLMRQIDIAATYKINKVHLHLSDDQGWRLEIKKWPELAETGGELQVGGGIGGFYTQEQFKEIVEYARKRYVEIVPEFDMPGHTNAMLASYGFLNPDGKVKELYTGTDVGFSSLMCRDEKTYSLIEDVIKEVAEISPSKYIHIGGDEAEATKKEDYDYFVERVSKIVRKYGKTPIGWDPIDTAEKIDKNTILQNWKDSNKEAIKKKMNMIISISGKTYLDMKYNLNTPYGGTWAGFNSVENSYNWDPMDYGPEGLILGIEAPLWTETITDIKGMDYMIYPRLLSYAEIGWTPKQYRDFEEYKIRLKAQEQRLDALNVNYYKQY